MHFFAFKVDKHIGIVFNSLDLTVNLQTWVVVFEFFGIGAAPQQPNLFDQTSPRKSPDVTHGNKTIQYFAFSI